MIINPDKGNCELPPIPNCIHISFNEKKDEVSSSIISNLIMKEKSKCTHCKGGYFLTTENGEQKCDPCTKLDANCTYCRGDRENIGYSRFGVEPNSKFLPKAGIWEKNWNRI